MKPMQVSTVVRDLLDEMLIFSITCCFQSRSLKSRQKEESLSLEIWGGGGSSALGNPVSGGQKFLPSVRGLCISVWNNQMLHCKR